MSAHLDDCEDDEENPIVSISLGLSCVFLIGSSNRKESPIPLLLRNGDAVVLSGESRLAFHGVASVLPFQIPFEHEDITSKLFSQKQVGIKAFGLEEQQLNLTNADRKNVRDYLSTKRINLNVRQVRKSGYSEIVH